MKYHFIGIGGVSMSGLAALMFEMGNEISGCDLKKFPISLPRGKAGNFQFPNKPLISKSKFQIWEGHSEDHITKDLDGVIVTSAAIHDNSPAKAEIEKAIKLKIPIIKRSEMIGKLMGRPGIIGIAVSGMHGKTTTSTMIALILEKAGLDPIALIGSNVKEWGGRNYRTGKGKYFVAEACEYERQMIDFKPKVEVITNLEEEHLDTYPGGMKDIRQAFKKFIKKLPEKGLLIVWREDKNIMSLAAIAKKKKIKVKEVSLKKIWPGLKLQIPGRHNLLDATFAARVCHELGVSHDVIKQVLNHFKGAERRFEIKGEKNGVMVIDDYGHHPSEIQAVIGSVKEFCPKKRLICVFQPHQYVRTKMLFKDFVKSFDETDELIITDIYLISGREPKEARADYSKELVKEINCRGINAKYISGYDKVLFEINKISKKDDIILTLGATDIYKVGEDFLSK